MNSSKLSATSFVFYIIGVIVVVLTVRAFFGLR